MAKKRWYDKDKSLEEGEIVLEDVSVEATTSADVETTELIEQESVNEPMEVAIPTTIEPTPTEIKFARHFTGHPSKVNFNELGLAEVCAAKGLLADFGNGKFARGYKWHISCK